MTPTDHSAAANVALTPDVAGVDLIDAGLYEAGFPHEAFTRLRARAPVSWLPFDDRVPSSREPGVWVVAQHADVEMVNRDVERFSAFDGPSLAHVPEMHGTMLVSMDGPEHVRQRRLISAGFTPRMIGQLEERCRRWAGQLVEHALEVGEVDFVAEVAYKLPMHMIADIVGIPEADREWLFATALKFLTASDPRSGVTADEAVLHQIEMFSYGQDLTRSKRVCPADDVWTTLSTAEVDGDGLGETELDYFFMLLTAAGSETTRNALAAGLPALLDHPDQLDRLRTDATVRKSAVEEILRWSSPVSYFARRAKVDLEISGTPIRAGERVTIWYASANRDEQVFEEPFTFDIARSPNPYVSFGGGGPHYCLGANLAKLEISILFDELLSRTTEIELVAPPVWQAFTIINPILLATKELRVRVA
jgi:cholest-4-en-3-one 26-monooxygenase